MAHWLITGGEWILIIVVLAAALPELAGAWQFLLAACHGWRNHYADCAPAFAWVSQRSMFSSVVLTFTL